MKGFTLIEMLIAVAIVGILSAMATVAYWGIVNDALRGRYDSVISNVTSAVTQYYEVEGKPGYEELTESELDGLARYISINNYSGSRAIFYTPTSFPGSWPSGAISLLKGFRGYDTLSLWVDPGIPGGLEPDAGDPYAPGTVVARRGPRIMNGESELARP